MGNLLNTYTNSGPVAGGGGGGGSTLTYTTTTPETIDYTDITTTDGTITLTASIPAGARLVRVIWEVVTPFQYTAWGFVNFLSSQGQILVDGQLLMPVGAYKYSSYGVTYRKTTAGYGEIFGLNGGTGKLVECAPNLVIGGSPATPQLKWDGWNNYFGASDSTDAGQCKVSFEYLVIS